MSPRSDIKIPSGAQIVTLGGPGKPFHLHSGAHLPQVQVVLESWGTLSADASNAILICHALTANSHAGSAPGEPDGWWEPLIGPGRVLDTDRYYVVCPNLLGSCYGSTGPVEADPRKGVPYGPTFPEISIRDIVEVQRVLMQRLGIRRLASVIGSSLGGMQVLEWGAMYPELCASLIPISTAVQQTAWCLALNAASRCAITGDPEWREGHYEHPPKQGLALARMIGMISYRSPQEFAGRFGRALAGEDPFDPNCHFQVEKYLRHQGAKLAERFDANAYLTLSRAMDRHDVGAGRGGVSTALAAASMPALCIGVSSDIRYPLDDQCELVRQLPSAKLGVIESEHGHDSFLIEYEQLAQLIGPFLSLAADSKEAA